MENINAYTLTEDIRLPLLPLRGIVAFPAMMLQIDVGRQKSLDALFNADASESKLILLVSQKDVGVEDPQPDDLCEVGTICQIESMVYKPRSRAYRVTVKGIQRAYFKAKPVKDKSYLTANAVPIVTSEKDFTPELIAKLRILVEDYENYVRITPEIPDDAIARLPRTLNIDEICDYICANSNFIFTSSQQILEITDVDERLDNLIFLVKTECLVNKVEKDIKQKLNAEIDRGQREYYLREEMKVIANELGDVDDPVDEAEEYKKQINELKCSDEIKNKLLKEANKLMKMPPGAHEATVVRNYIETCLEIPFGKYSKESINLAKSRKILDRDHYGLDKVKDRIIEALAVLKRAPDYNGQIICLYGPPGVGKTSIVKSLAESMNRKYVRIALGGIHDEAVIRGHRRTYIGAMRGRIIDAVISSGVMNPIILLDEIDKLGMNNFNGDPSSALLEALDPEQNRTFTDQYIDFPVDLSKVLFITTANDTSTISAPLYDRMEVIELNSYTAEEKFNIAKRHLIKKALGKHNFTARQLKISDGAVYRIIDSYTREAGVRALEKQINALCRKAALELESGAKSVKIDEKNISDYLGTEKYLRDEIPDRNLVGTVNGLAWTSVGGTMLPIEVSALEGTGKLELTGSLGDVMKESARTAISYVRSRADSLGIDTDFYKTKDIHIHAPEAAVPKDGPSAGLAITTALVSELTGIPIKANVAMTGEISLKGRALAIGGLKEKSMAAYKAGCDTVIIPKDNEKDLAEICTTVAENIDFITVSSFDEVMPIALEYVPESHGITAYKTKKADRVQPTA